MRKLYIDGSARGMTVGCGIAIVDLNNLVETYYSHKIMIKTEAMYGEYYALYEALKIIRKRNYKVTVINTDNLHFFSMFERVNGMYVMKKPVSILDEVIQPLVLEIHTLLYEITKGHRSRLIIEEANEENENEIFYRNIVHYESRRYMSQVDEVYLSDTKLFADNNHKTKSVLNRLSAKKSNIFDINEEKRLNNKHG